MNEITLSTEQLIRLLIQQQLALQSNDLLHQAETLVNSLPTWHLSNAQINGLLNVAFSYPTVAKTVQFIVSQQQKEERREPDKPSWTEKPSESRANLAELLRGRLDRDYRELARALLSNVQQKLRGTFNREDEAVNQLTEDKEKLNDVHVALSRDFLSAFAAYYQLKSQ